MARIGVFVCWCGSNIAETVDSVSVAEYAGRLPGVVVSQDYKYTCSDPGQKMITDAIKEHDLTGVVVASCSPRMHEVTFRRTVAGVGLNPHLLEMANIREHCSWVHNDREKGTAKAKVLVRMIVEKVKRNHSLQPIKVPVTNRALVIGAGIAGIQAALDIAKQGREVVLVEKEPSIGGHMSQLDETFPTLDCSQCILTPRMVEIVQDKNITLHTYSEIEEVGGFVGNFKVKIRKKARSVDIDKCTGCGECSTVCPVRNKPHFEKIERALPELDAEEAKAMEEVLDGYRTRKEGLLGLLQDIQAKYNYLPRKLLEYSSVKLEVPLSQIYGVANFYKAFSLKPRGKYIISVCMGTACHVRGGNRMLETIEEVLGIKAGETREDLKFTLETVNCLGACALGPLIVVNEAYHGHLTIPKLKKILENYEKS